MTQNQFRRFRPVSSIAEQLHSGVATLHPQPPPESSSVPDRRDFGNIGYPLQYVHTGVVLPLLSQLKKPRMPPQKTPWAARPNKRAWEKQHLLYHNGEEHQTAQQYTADIRERARKDVADLHKEGVSQRNEIEIKDRRRKNWEHEEEVKKRMETHINLISLMESASASFQTIEAE
ncbi:hypothetical protein E1301_Tti019562 [Triplophysa tibetana]|uniref:Uncharacterized protein n=1 Tax=Triplophysa tibetana TaxID=1572043 RepID=A0A5A9N687_9TELE|nr:hypothetical protein E1301_Tti019562 [Triplophysa tibetana]